MKDKLAEEIYKAYIGDGQMGVDFEKKHIIEAMQAYHESKMREAFERENQYVTDEDIEVWAEKNVRLSLEDMGITKGQAIFTHDEVIFLLKSYTEIGAKAMRDGKIKHVSRDNE